MRKNLRMPILGAALALGLLVAACGSGGDSATQDGPTITVGSAGFTESEVLAEVYAQALAAEGYPVEKRLGIGSREQYLPALERGEIDMIPEYTGNLLREVSDAEPTSDPQETYDRLVAELSGDLTVLDYADAQDKNVVAVTEETAEEYALEQVSDLEGVSEELVFGGSPECPERDDCLRGLREVYGLEFREVQTLDAGGPTTVSALEGGAVDVTFLFTTQPFFKTKPFVQLEDDQGIQAAQSIVPLVRTEIVDAYGDEFETLVNSITERFTEEILIDLNTRVDVDNEDADAAARQWLEDNGFLE